MVATAIYFKSPGITFPFVTLVQAQYLENFHRQLVGLLLMEVLIVLLNLLRAVFLCKDFLRFARDPAK